MTQIEDRAVVPVTADTTRGLYLFESGHLPVYYLPRSDVRFDLLESSDRTSHCPHKGDASDPWS